MLDSNLFKMIFNLSPYAMFIYKLGSATLLAANKAFLSDMQLTEAEAIGKSIYELGVLEDQYVTKTHKERLLKNHQVNNQEITRTDAEGKTRYYMYSAKLFTSNDSTLVLNIAADVTQQRRVEQQLRHAQKMDAIGQLAGGVAHDFNNVLAGIYSAAEIMLLENMSTPEGKDYLNMIINSSKRAADLTQKLLQFARKQQIDEVPVNIHQAINEAVNLLKASLDKLISIEIDLAAKDTIMLGDLSQLMNIFLNLGVNAGHALPNGGKIRFSTRNSELDPPFCQTHNLKSGKYIIIEVEDNGQGIPKDIISKIFDPYFTTKEQGKGTGLGLAAVQGAVEQHGGLVTVYSETGMGTVFHIYLPVVDSNVTAPTTKRPVFSATGTVLLVDDDEIIALTSKARLELLGYTVLIAHNGLEAIELYRAHQHEIVLVLLDMIMPEMNGYDCLQNLQQIDPEVQVIVTSGFAQASVMKVVKLSGVKTFLRKPYSMEELIAAISGEPVYQ